MKRILLLLFTLAAITLSSFGQAPEGFKYQAVVRDVGNTILSDQVVGMQLTIQQGSIGGTTVYQETFAPTTNTYGLVNLEIGTGTVISGDFASIDWANGPYFIETAVDVTGGTSYTVMGTSQLMSVPYALHSKSAESAVFSGDGLYIGMEYEGGIIFHLYTTGEGVQHGLVVALEDLGATEWGHYETDIPGADSYWDGASNTTDILNAGGSANEAAGLCANYEAGGFDDWYLPSLQELNLLWNNYYDVAKALNNHPDGEELLTTQASVYWSSTELAGGGGAEFFYFYVWDAWGEAYYIKVNFNRVRAVRAF